MKRNVLGRLLLMGAVTSVFAFAEMAVDKSNGMLTITSDKSGKMHAKVIGPKGEVLVDEKYEGSSFSWTPSGADGAYRYDVRMGNQYVGGSVEVKDGQLMTEKKE